MKIEEIEVGKRYWVSNRFANTESKVCVTKSDKMAYMKCRFVWETHPDYVISEDTRTWLRRFFSFNP